VPTVIESNSLTQLSANQPPKLSTQCGADCATDQHTHRATECLPFQAADDPPDLPADLPAYFTAQQDTNVEAECATY
jgi:hypothetical protein